MPHALCTGLEHAPHRIDETDGVARQLQDDQAAMTVLQVCTWLLRAVGSDGGGQNRHAADHLVCCAPGTDACTIRVLHHKGLKDARERTEGVGSGAHLAGGSLGGGECDGRSHGIELLEIVIKRYNSQTFE